MHIHLLRLRRLKLIERNPFMRNAIYLLGALLVLGTFLASVLGTPIRPGPGNHVEAGSVRPELEYLKAVNGVAPPRDPQLLFLLMAQYTSANMQSEGAEFFSARLKEFGPRLTDSQKGAVFERHRIVASPACIFRFVVAPNRLRERHDRDSRSSQAAFRRATLRCELDCRRGPFRTSKLFPSAEGSAG